MIGDVQPRFQSIELLDEDPPYSASLIQKLGLRGLHCGCAANLHAGWLNTDFEGFLDPRGNRTRRDLLALIDDSFYYMRHDASKPFPIDDNSFDWCYSEHFVEHLTPRLATEWLKEVRRMLKPGGHVRISTPDLRRYVEGYRDPEGTFFAETFRHLPPASAFGAGYLGEEGAQDRRCWMMNQIFYMYGHKWIYDFEELSHRAALAGFDRGSATECSFRQGRVEQVARLDLEHRRFESMYAEIFC